MSPVDVTNTSSKTQATSKGMTPTASLKTPSSKCLYERHLIFRLSAPLITQEIILCQSLMPHVKCVTLHRKGGLFVRINIQN